MTQSSKENEFDTTRLLASITITAYIFIMPCLLFQIIFNTTFGIPVMPSIEDSISFLASIIISSIFSNVAGFLTFTIMLYSSLLLKEDTVNKFNRFFNNQRIRIHLSLVNARVYAVYIATSLLSGALSLFQIQLIESNFIIDVNKALILIIFLLTLLAISLSLLYFLHQTKDLLLGYQRIDNQDSKNKLLISTTFIVLSIALAMMTSKSVIQDHLVFPIIEGKKLSIYQNAKVQYLLDCNGSNNRIKVRPSYLNEYVFDKNIKDINAKQISVINSDIGKSICNRNFTVNK